MGNITRASGAGVGTKAHYFFIDGKEYSINVDNIVWENYINYYPESGFIIIDDYVTINNNYILYPSTNSYIKKNESILAVTSDNLDKIDTHYTTTSVAPSEGGGYVNNI